MKKLFVLVVTLVLFLVLSGCAEEKDPVCFENEVEVNDVCVEKYSNITNSKLAEMLMTPDAYQFVDVRTQAEYDNEKIPGFNYNFDFYKFENNFSLVNGLDKDKPVVIMCNSGNRSVSASNIFYEAGYTEIYNLTNGIKGWNGATE